MKRILFGLSCIAFLQTPAQETFRGLFWKISGNGLEKPSYLYGTMHAMDERIFQFQDGMLDIFDECESFAMELNLDSVNPMEVMGMLVMDSAYTIQMLLSKEDYALVNNYFRDSLGQSLLLYNRLQPLLISSMITKNKLQESREDALDVYFYKRAKKQEMKIRGLETIEEQVNAFSTISYKKQAEALVKSVKNISKEDNDEMEMLLDNYVRGNLDELLEFTRDKEHSVNFEKAFLTDRNQRMFMRIESLIRKSTVFAAVGAAHLPGEKGVITLLRNSGYTVEAVK